MGTVSIPFNDPDIPASGMIHIENGPWVGYKKFLYFSDTVYGNEGTILCDCRESTPRLRFDRTFSPMRGVDETGRFLSMMLRPFLAGQFPPRVFETVSELYTRDYCLESTDPLMEASLDDPNKTVAEQVLEAVGDARILVAGCGKGEGLLKLRELGADAWGIDISPDLDEILLQSARPWVRRGSVHSIPFQDKEKFDVLLCLGILEHLPEDFVPKVTEEAKRLGIKRLITMIDHDDFIRPGHLTLRPLSWWAEKFSNHYFPAKTAFPLPLKMEQFPWSPDIKHRLRLWVLEGEEFDEEFLKRKAEELPMLS